MKKVVLSCIQPTGDMHLGNYFGAVKNWVDLQSTYDCIYGIVDYHAITMPYDTKKLRNRTWDLVYDLVAVGIEPENIFIQSLIPEHTELSWIFSCFCSYGQLTRMTQFKDKSKGNEAEGESFISAGLLGYPVLQAADILIYRADFVPVGKDQEQHLELTRDIAQRFNHIVGHEYFVLPESLFTETPKIRSTADPSRKMSKSAGDKHYIGIFSEETRIRKQIRSAVTDTGEGNENSMSEGVENLFEILRVSNDSGSEYQEVFDQYKSNSLQYSKLKDAVADNLMSLLKPFAEKRAEVVANKRELKNQIRDSSAQTRKRAQETLKDVKDLLGLMNVKF